MALTLYDVVVSISCLSLVPMGILLRGNIYFDSELQPNFRGLREYQYGCPRHRIP